jgi:hypothetical protein
MFMAQSQQEKNKFMDKLAYIKALVTTPNWILGGDFNMIMSLEEKAGGSKRLDPESGKFKTLPEHLNLVDIENSNGTFTWSNRRSGSQHVACRLDRFLVTEELIESGLCMESLILPKAGSDHWPIALQIAAETTPALKPFRFEKFWLTHPDFQHLATTWWNKLRWTTEPRCTNSSNGSKTSSKCSNTGTETPLVHISKHQGHRDQVSRDPKNLHKWNPNS